MLQQEEGRLRQPERLVGYSSADDFEEEVSATDFIDTTGLVSYGDNYNVHWGMLNNEVLYERQNKYHKPLFSLRHSWRVSEKLYISNMAYASYGYGGGTRLENSLGGGDYTPDGQVDFQKFYNSNTIGGLFGPPIDPTYSDSLLKSGRILRKLFNNHYWYGVLSTFRHETSESLTLSGGVDFRTYQGEHYAEVFDLLGGDYFVDTRNANASTNMRLVGDKIGYHNDAFVRWGGAFALLEYKGYLWNAFLNVSAVTQGYKSVDYFAAAGGRTVHHEWLEVDSGVHHQDWRQLQLERVRQHVRQPRPSQPNASLPQRSGLQQQLRREHRKRAHQFRGMGLQLQQVPIQRERQRLLHGLAKPPVAIAASLRNRRRRHRSRQCELDERTAQRN